jgi:hypothetical protein
MTEDNRPVYKRSEIVIPECPKCSGRMDPHALLWAPAEPGIRGITLDCHYGDKCRECGYIIRKASCCNRCKAVVENPYDEYQKEPK